MKALFLVFHGFASYNGISKKIFYQVDAMRRCGIDTRLCYFSYGPDGSQRRMADSDILQDYGGGIRAKILKRTDYSALTDYVRREGIGFVYMRSDHNANPFLTRWLRKMKAMGVRVVMEVPTYPYDSEYSRSPLRRKLHLAQDKLFRRSMARQLHRIVTFTDLETIFGVPTIRISNGIDFGSIPMKTRTAADPSTLNLIGVADIHFWHGFDRVITGLAAYLGKPHNVNVVFHVVGSGTPDEVAMLKDMTTADGIGGNVIFHGARSGEELDALFEQADMGIASLGRHRCGIDRIKTLKNREYAARGIPFVYSETDDDFDRMPYVMKAPADDSPLDIKAVTDFYRDMTMTPTEIRSSVEGSLSWQTQMQKVIDQTLTLPSGMQDEPADKKQK